MRTRTATFDCGRDTLARTTREGKPWQALNAIFIQQYKSQLPRASLLSPTLGTSQSLMPSFCAVHAISPRFVSPFIITASLVASPPGLGDDLGHLVDLSLATAECAESLLRQFPRALVLAVAEQFDHTALVWCKAAKGIKR